MGLLGDLGMTFGSRMAPIYHMPFVKTVSFAHESKLTRALHSRETSQSCLLLPHLTLIPTFFSDRLHLIYPIIPSRLLFHSHPSLLFRFFHSGRCSKREWRLRTATSSGLKELHTISSPEKLCEDLYGCNSCSPPLTHYALLSYSLPPPSPPLLSL